MEGDKVGGIELGILGRIVVRVDGVAVPVGRGKLRTLLACLLLRLNRAVAVDDLVDQLWGEDPPADAKRVLQTYVTRLRQALGKAAPRLVTRAPGYLFEANESALDLVRFRRHVMRAQAADDPEIEAAELRAGLALWRGEPLADAPSEALRQFEVPRLQDERLQALERRIEVELSLGRHAELVSELYGLTRENPLRENLWAQLMVALHRSGRQADALLAFQQVSAIMREELRQEPGDRLRAVHRDVLSSDTRTDTTPRSVVRQLPGDVSDFVGRHQQIKRIGELVDSGSPIVTLSGPPGIGKTALAVHVAHDLAARFPDGQLFLDLRGYSAGTPLTAGDALARFLRALGIPPDQIPTEVDELSSLFRSTVAGRRILVVLDNAAGPEPVRPLLPGSPTCPVIITSRDELRGLTAIDGARRVPVDVLTEDEALGLLAKIAGQHLIEVESVAAHRLAAACGHLPLALRIAAANLIGSHHRTVEAFVDELVAGDRLSKLEIVGDDRSDVRVVFGLSYEALRTEPARLFRLLGLVLGPTFDAYAAANLAGLTLAEAGSLLDLLAAANLIQHAGPGRYQFHDLIRAYAAALCGEHDRPADRDAAYLRLVTYYATTVDAIAELLYPEWERVPIQSILEGPAREDLLTLAEQLDWLDAERPNLVAVARQPDGNAAHLVCSLASGMYCYLNTQRHDRDWRTMYTVGLAIATRADDRRAMAIMHFGLAMLECAHADTGAGLAHYDHAIDLYRELGDRRGEAQMMSGKCMVVLSMGKFETALPAAESVLAIQQEIGDRVGEAKTLGRIGLIYAENGPVREAVEVLSRALLICDEQEMRVGAMFMTLYLAFARLYSGDPNGAIVEFEVAAALCTELHYHEELADAYEGISSAYVALGQPEEACRHAERAVELLTGAVSSYQFEISTLVTLGEAQLSAGRIDEAMANLLRALEQAETLKFLLNVRRGELALASCHRHRGEYELATELLKTVEASTYQPYRGQALVELARIHLAQNDPSSAIEHASRGLEISRTCQYRIDEAQALWVLGEALRTQGERAEAELCLQSAISIFNEIGSRLAAQVKP